MSLKDKVLEKLESERGKEISGQELANLFNVSRNAVWKAVQALKNSGYEISSTHGNGYALSENCDALSAGLISKYSGGVKVFALDQTDSTNEEAKRLLAHENGKFIVVAEQQSGGRGRRGRSFFSPKGAGLYMTAALNGESDIESALGITSYAAVCVVNAIKKLTGKDAGIKWVNDVFLDGKKICGILTEAVTDFETRTVKNVIVGIGINLKPYALPEELKDIVGFVDAKTPLRNRLAAEIAGSLFLYGENRLNYIEEYKKHSIVLGKEIDYYKDEIKYRGKALDIDRFGGLKVLREDGAEETLSSGEITLRLSDRSRTD